MLNQRSSLSKPTRYCVVVLTSWDRSLHRASGQNSSPPACDCVSFVGEGDKLKRFKFIMR